MVMRKIDRQEVMNRNMVLKIDTEGLNKKDILTKQKNAPLRSSEQKKKKLSLCHAVTLCLKDNHLDLQKYPKLRGHLKNSQT